MSCEDGAVTVDWVVLTAAGGRELIKSFALKQGLSFSQINCYVRKEVALDVTAWQQLMAKLRSIDIFGAVNIRAQSRVVIAVIHRAKLDDTIDFLAEAT